MHRKLELSVWFLIVGSVWHDVFVFTITFGVYLLHSILYLQGSFLRGFYFHGGQLILEHLPVVYKLPPAGEWMGWCVKFRPQKRRGAFPVPLLFPRWDQLGDFSPFTLDSPLVFG